ncbi:MAG: Stk1 family PASTA domain-containing Ser/Thr kinase [Ruminococcaceae bacterium]|nr:Stk1 family PASTA domain-containing Ser/Thr kinase [Oscillospiraceae bacterium]
MSTNDKFDELVGQIIDERYKILSVIGIGGMSVVFKAEDLKAGRVVAIKVLNEHADTDGHAVKRFTNESRAISMLSHENIVKIFDMSLGGDLKYIVMELADGKTLKEYMEEKDNKLSLEETLNFTEQILLALVHAHEKGVIHRDVKPHNMIVLKDGKLKVTDFGIAKAPGGDTISMTDKALGTVYYISPEQASGKPTGTYSDIYSVGVMLYEMATGKLPFEADTPVSVAMKQISDDPEKPTQVNPELPKGVEQIILKAMSKDPEDRFKSAQSMLRAINIIKQSPMIIFEEKKPVPKSTNAKQVNNDMKNTQKKGGKKNAPPAKVTYLPIILGMVTAFFAVLLISGIVLLASLFKTSANTEEPTHVEVPNVIGSVLSDELLEELEEQHFDVKVEVAQKFNDSFGYGEIYGTKPSAGEVKKITGSTGKTNLTLYVNPQEGKMILEDYTIMTVTSAKLALKKRGFNDIKVVEANHDTVLENHVFKTYPEAGQEVSVTDTITLYVSLGKPLQNVMAMPNLVGKTKGQAMVELEKFEVEYVTVSNSKPQGTVVGQSVTPYTVISPEFCDKITLWVSDGNGKEAISDLDIYLYMPNLVGENIITAEEKMAPFVENGIKIQYLKSPTEAEVGIITDQSLDAGTRIMVNYSETITIYYGTGITKPEPEPEPENPEVTEPTDNEEKEDDGPVVIV